MNIMLGHAKQIVLSNLHNIHKLPNIFVLTYTQQNIVWRKNWWFYKVHFSTLMVDFTDSSSSLVEPNVRWVTTIRNTLTFIAKNIARTKNILAWAIFICFNVRRKLNWRCLLFRFLALYQIRCREPQGTREWVYLFKKERYAIDCFE